MEHRRPEERPTRILGPITVLVLVIMFGAFAMYGVGRGRWSLAESFYLAINAVSTVGFSELRGMEDVRFARPIAVVIILAGLGTLAYFQSSLTALLVQGVIGERFRLRRMQKRVESLSNQKVAATERDQGTSSLLCRLKRARSRCA